MNLNSDFEEIRPYNDSEVCTAIRRLVQEKGFLKVVGFFFPEYSIESIVEKLLTIETIYDFQTKIAMRLTKKIIELNTNGLFFNGLENIDKTKNYLIISNHRDIILDSAFLNHGLHHAGYKTTEIAIGSNLLILKWIYDLVKLNKTFIVKRNLSQHEFYDYSIVLSRYIRQTITERKESIWIAQREGRTKNGFDKTQPGLLKMFNISGKNSIEENFQELNIIPLCISYQYEPCDTEKVAELYNRMHDENFKKTKTADLMSMGRGLISPKGVIHYTFDKVMNEEINQFKTITNKNEKLQKIADLIDNKIYKMYNLSPFNYVAAAEYFKTNKYDSLFTNEDKMIFEDYINKSTRKLAGDKEMLRRMFIEIYANPVSNFCK